MADEITNTVANETPVAPVATEENNVANQEPQVEAPENAEQQPVENSNTEQTETTTSDEVQTELTAEQMRSKLKEYEVREEEERLLKEKLGMGDVDSRTYDYMNIDQQVVNQGKQFYLRLCNEYGIDADPEKIDASVEALKQSDPAKAYEFQRKFENLGNDITNRRNAIQQENAYYEVSKFSNEYNGLLSASPALNNIMTQYVQTTRNLNGMYGQLKNVMEIVLPAYQEAFEAGKRFALQDRAKQDTTAVSGGIATANTQTYTPGTTFTREQISRMSTEEFSKYEKEIERQMIEGKII